MTHPLIRLIDRGDALATTIVRPIKVGFDWIGHALNINPIKLRVLTTTCGVIACLILATTLLAPNAWMIIPSIVWILILGFIALIISSLASLAFRLIDTYFRQQDGLLDQDPEVRALATLRILSWGYGCTGSFFALLGLAPVTTARVIGLLGVALIILALDIYIAYLSINSPKQPKARAAKESTRDKLLQRLFDVVPQTT